MPAKPEKLIKRFEALKSKRVTWEGHWQELADFILPRKADIVTVRTPGEKRTHRLFDATAIEANELLASALHGMLTSPQAPWFELTLRDRELAADEAVKGWLENVAGRMTTTLNNSNFQTEIHEVYLDLGCFGTAALFIEEDEEALVRFSARPLSEIFIAQDRRGKVDTVFRKFPFTGRQAVQLWGEKAVGERILKKFREAPDEEAQILHAVFPRADRLPGRSDGVNMPVASIYLDIEARHVIAEGGFEEMPYTVARWTKATGETFGRSPGMKGLADIKMLNEMCKTTLKAAQKVVDPPMLVADDGVMLPVRTTPASLNYARFLADGSDPIRPLQTGGNLPIGLEMEEQRRKAIRSAFFVDQLQLVGGPQMTATEVLQRTEEKLRLLGPVLGRLHSELLRPLIDRVFAIMFRADELPPPPHALKGGDIDVEYVSPIAKAQRATRAQGLLRVFEVAAPLTAAQPEMLDNIDGDAVVRELWDLFSVPGGLLRERKAVSAIRQARGQAAAEEAAKDDAERLVKGAATTVKVLDGAGSTA